MGIFPEVPVPVEASESLAEAVCCDNRTTVFAEPQFLYQEPGIDFYSKLQDGVTTFFDSVCGLPLFRAPLKRSLDDFKADTDEHGWPSFRLAEVVAGNVVHDSDGFVYSICGTHLGSYLPDEFGPRWCMDLSCIAGNPKQVVERLVLAWKLTASLGYGYPFHGAGEAPWADALGATLIVRLR